ncbi:hypothetical protein D915_007865 [Fasciola hepatica]|uniref:Uncharacterized protein n=1 Tax=Fasciola hepatica TaxID=6192 RepID=A0A2H1C1F4_FASHE|nr:hypothetical protein D915_007865 [Fasciola hepatica]
MEGIRVNTSSAECEVRPEDCVGVTRSKWICSPGIHPSEYFHCADWTPEVEAINKPEPRIRWNENVSRVKNCMEPWRPWVYDQSGWRLSDWNASEIDCKKPKLGNFEYKPVCLTEPAPLNRYFNQLDNLDALHPRYLLEHYVYRDPDEYLPSEEQGKLACTFGCDARPFRELKPASQREIMRMRFAKNNYMTFDDWKEDPNDDLLHGLQSENKTDVSTSDQVVN